MRCCKNEKDERMIVKRREHADASLKCLFIDIGSDKRYKDCHGYNA